jgi:hypothetical protein
MVQNLETFVLKVSDVCVLMHAEDFGLIDVGQPVDVVF